jgi:hypothetical protein
VGIFDKIGGFFSSPVEACADEVFGPLRREGKGDWEGEVAFQHPPTKAESLQLLIDAGEGRPTEAQRVLYREIIARYAQMWPQIAAALAEHHPTLKTVQSLEQHIEEPCLCLDPITPGQPPEWSFQYTFDLEDEGDMGYFAEFVDWKLVDIGGAD